MAEQDQRRRMSNEVAWMHEQWAYRIKIFVYPLQPLGWSGEATL